MSSGTLRSCCTRFGSNFTDVPEAIGSLLQFINVLASIDVLPGIDILAHVDALM